MKKLGVIFIGLLLSAVFVPLASATGYPVGDSDCNGHVEVTDVIIQKYLIAYGDEASKIVTHCGTYQGAEALQVSLANSDVDHDGDVDVFDALLTARFIAG